MNIHGGDTIPGTRKLVLNGKPVETDAAGHERLSQVLRECLGARDVKVGCNAGDCGACTVLLDGLPICACTSSLAQAEGRRVETLTGLIDAEPLARRLSRAFLRHGAAQCGICTPGVLVSATALLRADPAPDEAAVKDALGGVLCRCTGYRKIIDAVLDATGRNEAHTGPGISGHVGQSPGRFDGKAKVEGTDLFGDDVAPQDALHVRVIRSPHHRARFSFGDLAEYVKSGNGLERVLTAADIPGRNVFGVIPAFTDQPVFAEGEAAFRGEAVAAVVGTAEAVAELDPGAFPVEWTELPYALTPDGSSGGRIPDIHTDRPGNVMCSGFVRKGDVATGLSDADIVVEDRFTTGFVEHAYIEPEAGFARRVGNRVEVHACTQAPVMDQETIADILGLDKSAVRVVPTSTGGGFGSKLDVSLQPYVALAAWVLNRPVRITYSRSESMQSTTKRHPSDIRLKIGADKTGRITGFDFEGIFNTGAHSSWGPTVANRVPVHASGPYRIGNYRAKATGIYTNCAPAGAFRGFGVPQSAVAQEVLFDDLADRLGLDRLEFRLLNALDNGAPTVTGQVFETGVGISACLQSLTKHWRRANAEAAEFNEAASADRSPMRRGVGIASGWYGCGNTSLPNPSTIKAGVRPDGRVVLHQGAADIGQGANTVVTQIFATALGVPAGGIEIVGGDTDITPDAGKTSASRQTFVSGNAARLAGLALRAKLLSLFNVSEQAEISLNGGVLRLSETGRTHSFALSELKADPEGYVLRAQETYDPPTRPLDENGQGIPYAVFGYTAQMVELTVDTGLGTVTLEKFTAAHDVGKAINPVLVEGQVHGGIAQGIGMALMEEFIPGRTENLHDYLIPTIGDVPPIETIIIEEADAHGPYGAKGLGEHVLIPTAPAILNAIRDASGARIRRLPATPDRVLAAIRTAQEG